VVGGEVDAVRLTRNGIGWIHRKHNCPL
jgi:hypothetical protein